MRSILHYSIEINVSDIASSGGGGRSQGLWCLLVCDDCRMVALHYERITDIICSQYFLYNVTFICRRTVALK